MMLKGFRSGGRMLALLLFVTAAASLSQAAADHATVPNPVTDYQGYTAYMMRSHFPNVTLVTQDGRKVRFYDDVIKGKTVMIQFMFVNCDRYCPMVTPNLVKVQKELLKRGRKDIAMVSITVDSAHDSPAVLKAYAEKLHVRPGWMFLTGSKEDVDLIRRQLGVYDPEEQKVEHMNVLTMGREPTGRWLAIEALAKPYDIVDTVLRLRTAGGVNPRLGRVQSQR